MSQWTLKSLQSQVFESSNFQFIVCKHYYSIICYWLIRYAYPCGKIRLPCGLIRNKFVTIFPHKWFKAKQQPSLSLPKFNKTWNSFTVIYKFELLVEFGGLRKRTERRKLHTLRMGLGITIPSFPRVCSLNGPIIRNLLLLQKTINSTRNSKI